MSVSKTFPSKLGVKPLGKRVIVEAVEIAETTEGGIILTGDALQAPDRACVCAVGADKEMKVSVGDTVYLPPFAGTAIDVGGEIYRVVNYDDLIAVTI